MSPLMMGRAAAVRAATKGKTDAAKAKLNARYGKQIAMAIKVANLPRTIRQKRLITRQKRPIIRQKRPTNAICGSASAAYHKAKETYFKAKEA